MNAPTPALALIEYESAAFGILAVDRMLKRSPIALLRCGTVHPGRYLAMIGGSVGSVEEAYEEGLHAGEVRDAVMLPDPHPGLAAALETRPAAADGDEALAVVETTTSPALLRAVDAGLKAAPTALAELRLSDDLGGRGLAVFAGGLTDLQATLAAASSRVGADGQMLARTLMPRVEPLVRDLVADGTAFRTCSPREPDGAETPGG